MREWLYHIYYWIRKKEIDKAKLKLKKVKTDVVFQAITSNCWKMGIQYDVVIKTADVVIVKFRGSRKNIILKYHRTDMVFVEEVNAFRALIEDSGAEKGIYITTGCFEGKVYKVKSTHLFQNYKLVDGVHFLSYQLGLVGSYLECLTRKKLKFYKYMPY